MRAVILLYAQDGYINIPVDNVKIALPEGDSDILQGALMFERDGKLVGMFQMSEVKGYYVTEKTKPETEILRCKDCKYHGRKDGTAVPWCEFHKVVMSDESYCSLARKQDDK